MNYDLKIRKPSEADYTTTEEIALKAVYLIAAAHATKHGPKDAAEFLAEAAKNLAQVAEDIARVAGALEECIADEMAFPQQDIREWLGLLERMDHEAVDNSLDRRGT